MGFILRLKKYLIKMILYLNIWNYFENNLSILKGLDLWSEQYIRLKFHNGRDRVSSNIWRIKDSSSVIRCQGLGKYS
jgi:hypothetical protein